jgi:hypothetical protein
MFLNPLLSAVSPSGLRPVDEPLGHEPFDVLRVPSKVEGLEAEWLRSSRSGPKGIQLLSAFLLAGSAKDRLYKRLGRLLIVDR